MSYKYTDKEVLMEAITFLTVNRPLREVSASLNVPLSTLHTHLTKRLPKLYPMTADNVRELLKTHRPGRKSK